MEIATKVTGNSLTATEFNQVPDELENVISDTSQTPSSGDLNQVGKAIADYASHGDYYTDSGVADAYVLSATGSKQSPTAYVDGFRARFIVGNTNTGASTVNVAGLGVKSIVSSGAALSAGNLTAGEFTEIQFDNANDRFELTVLALASTTVKGIVELATDAETQTGTDTARAVTPASLQSKVSSTSAKGIVELATSAETITGSDTTRAGTSAGLQAKVSSVTAKGIVELATNTETITGTDTTRAVTSAGLQAKLDLEPTAASGTYSPSETSVANLDSTPSAAIAQFMRVGSTVTVSGTVSVNPTSTATLTQFRLSLPIASNFSGTEQAAGVASGLDLGASAGDVFKIIGNIANDEVLFEGFPVGVGNNVFAYTYTYRII